MKPDDGYFSKIRGALTLYCEDVEGAHVRFILGHHGEDAAALISQFWQEHPDEGRFTLIPLFDFGNAPRKELCTGRSLTAALPSANIEPGSAMEQAWASACHYHAVPYKQKHNSTVRSDRDAA